MTLVECAGEVWRKSRVSWLGGGVYVYCSRPATTGREIEIAS